jgi:hypothetical protein
MKRHFVSAALLAGIFIFAGCWSEVTKDSGIPMAKPYWATHGGGVFSLQSSAVFYGVGFAAPLSNSDMQRSQAQQRARVDLTRTLQNSISSFVNDFLANDTDLFDHSKNFSPDTIATSVSLGVTADQLATGRFVDYWEETKSKTLYTLLRLDLKDDFYRSYKENLIRSLRQNGLTKGMHKEDADLEESIDRAIQAQRSHVLVLLGVSQTTDSMETDHEASVSSDSLSTTSVAQPSPMNPSDQLVYPSGSGR